MRKATDPLYSVFEKHLMTALVEDETTDSFLDRVVTGYIGHLQTRGTTIPQAFRETLETDLKDEVLEMLRKKTYGHYDLASYRKAKGVETPLQTFNAPESIDSVIASENEKARRNRRAC